MAWCELIERGRAADLATEYINLRNSQAESKEAQRYYRQLLSFAQGQE